MSAGRRRRIPPLTLVASSGATGTADAGRGDDERSRLASATGPVSWHARKTATGTPTGRCSRI